MANKPPVTPKGIAIYPKLTTPDTKFKEEGEYSIKLRLSAEAAAPMIAEIDALMEENFKKEVKENKGKKVKKADAPYKEDTENPGFYIFHFKMKASGVSKKTGKPWTQRPSIADGKGKTITVEQATALNIGGGSEVKVAYELFPFFTGLVGAGVSLRLVGVQIIKLVKYEARVSFDAEEGGFDATEEAATFDATTEGQGEAAAPPSDEKDF